MSKGKKGPGERGHAAQRQPPKASQFKPGQSGNPSGRPRKEKPPLIDELSLILERVLSEELQTATGSMKLLEAMVRRVASAGLQDPKLGAKVLPLYTELLSRDRRQAENDLEDVGEEILEAFYERWTRRRGGAASDEGTSS
jgi:hypothetical protein